MPKNVPINIPPGDPENMRRQVVQAINRLGTELAKSDTRTADMDMGGNRIINCADPGAQSDVVTLRYLKKKLDELTQQHVQRKGGQRFTIVFSHDALIVPGVQASPYVFMEGRTGTPAVVRVACLPTGTGTADAKFNLSWYPNGTSVGTSILTNDLVLTAGSNISSTTGFIQPIIFGVTDLITPVVNTAGGVSLVTIELEVAVNGA